MLLRREDEGVVAVGQPAHAWVAGQLARAWAKPFAPREEVCLAAEQHDVGWTEWEAAPELDPETGLPYTFSALPPLRRLELWSGAAERLLPLSRYAALLVSLHGTLLVERFPPRGGREVKRAAAAFLEREGAFQERLLESLRAEPAYLLSTGPEAVARNRELLFVVDWLSLALVHGVREEREVAGLVLAPVEGDPARVRVSPWPFRLDEPVAVVCDGRRLEGTFADEAAMRRALAEAPRTTIRTELVPG